MHGVTRGLYARVLRRLGGNDEMDRYFQRSDTITLSAGDAKQANAVTHTINPWPRNVGDRRIATDARRVGGAVTRYSNNRGRWISFPISATRRKRWVSRRPVTRISTSVDRGRAPLGCRCRSAGGIKRRSRKSPNVRRLVADDSRRTIDLITKKRTAWASAVEISGSDEQFGAKNKMKVVDAAKGVEFSTSVRSRFEASDVHAIGRVGFEGCRGSVLIEATMLMPFYLVTLMSDVRVSWYFHKQQLVESGVRDAARYLARTRA